MNDDELISRCRSGDQQGYAELFGRYKERALHVSYAITGDRTLSEDATQEAFIKAFQTLRNLRPGASFGPWFYAIVANRARRLASRRKWRWLPLLTIAAVSDPHAEAALHSVEDGPVWRAIQSLPVDLRVVVALRHVLDMTEPEVAAAAGVPVGTVKSRMHRARELLKRELCLNEEGETSWMPLTK